MIRGPVAPVLYSPIESIHPSDTQKLKKPMSLMTDLEMILLILIPYYSYFNYVIRYVDCLVQI